MATVWLDPKHEYDDAIANMDLWWVGETYSCLGSNQTVAIRIKSR